MKKSVSGLNMMGALLLIGIVPALIIALVMLLVSVVDISEALEESSYERLQACATSVSQFFLCDIEEGVLEPTDELSTNFIDSLKNQEIELTLFEKDTRSITSILDADNPTGRNIGTTCNADIWTQVQKGEIYKADGIIIGGEEYYVAYVPITLNDGTVWGMGFAGEKESVVKEEIHEIVRIIIVIAIIIFVISLIAIVVMARTIQKSMKTVAGGLQSIAEGNLNTKINTTSKIVEIRQIIDSSTDLRDRLTDVVSQVKENAEALDRAVETVDDLSENSSAGANQISMAVGEVASGNQTLAENVESVNGEVLTMESGINDISSNVESLADNSNGIKTANMDASSYMNKVMESSDKSVFAVDQITRQIDETNKAVEQIDTAVAMITSIAAQTNLLSLNASIEAARAGEAGKGFAVVADEIRSLADQSRESAEEIQRIINDVKEQSLKTVTLSSQVAEVINEEKGYVKEVQQKFDILSSGVESSIEGINSIRNKTVQLNSAKDNIVSSVSDLSAISEENAASSQEMTASVEGIAVGVGEIKSRSNEMREMSQRLKDSVDYFKV